MDSNRRRSDNRLACELSCILNTREREVNDAGLCEVY